MVGLKFSNNESKSRNANQHPFLISYEDKANGQEKGIIYMYS